MIRTLTSVLLALLLLSLTAFARPDTAVAQDDDTQLSLYMKEINRGLRGLRQALEDPANNAETVKSLRELQILTIKSRNEKPEMTADIPEAKREEFLMGYQSSMIEFTTKLMELEMLVLAGEMEKADKLREAIGELKKPAHQKFKK